MTTRVILLTVLIAVTTALPFPYSYANLYAMPDPQGCCMPSPMCFNPCPPPQPQQPCCMPSPTCFNACPGYAPQPYQKGPRQPVVYAPLPGEIVFKLLQNWDPELLETGSPAFQILEGNLRSAVQAVIGPSAQVTNVYFREGYVPGNPPSRPKTVAHMMVNGGSDAASILEHSVTPDGSLGDGLKVYRDSFNAY